MGGVNIGLYKYNAMIRWGSNGRVVRFDSLSNNRLKVIMTKVCDQYING